jgi:hypothetical protein
MGMYSVRDENKARIIDVSARVEQSHCDEIDRR